MVQKAVEQEQVNGHYNLGMKCAVGIVAGIAGFLV